jgi:lipopolysaccharide/colanic/teichoic acid biosynthesis glycosyltransferase
MATIDSPHLRKDEDWIKRFDPNKRVLTGKAYRAAKRIMDLAMVFLAMPFWGPVMVMVALLIRITSPGAPVLFYQQRTGRGGRRFRMVKFRSMVPNAEALKGTLAKLNSSGELAGPLKLENDPRITKLGRILRKTSLDELPQLFNVIKGDMILVGPRPTSWSPESYKLWHTERLDVSPGITGLFQVYGRGSQDFDEWLRWDIRYIEKRSLWFDIIILIKTFTVLFKQRGAR